ncbi:hypothetical protein AMTRI_Chr04g250560 [Amborella trichopoda]
MALNSVNIVIIMNNQVTVLTTASSLLCRVAATPRCLNFLPSQSHWIFLIIGHRIMLRSFTFLDNWTLPIIFHCPISLLVILYLIFILCIIIIVGIHVHCLVSFIGCCNIRIIIHIGNCPTKKVLV